MTDRIELPEGWRINGDELVCERSCLSVRVDRGGELVVSGDLDGCVFLPLVVVHAATKLAEVTTALDAERSRMLAERFVGVG